MAERQGWAGLSRSGAFSRRALLRGSGLVATAAVLGCGRRTPSSAAPRQAARQPKRGGTLSYAGGRAGSSYDTQGLAFEPYMTVPFPAKSFTLFYERLLAYNPRTYALEPEIARAWEQPSQTEYVFHLQPNVRWQQKPPVNGRLLTADDVTFSLERARTDDPRYPSRSLLALVDTIASPDKATVRITTRAPDASALFKLGAENVAITAPEVYQKFSKLSTADSVVGTGPFVMTSEEENVGAQYARNPNYWKAGLPYLDAFQTRAFTDPLAAWAAFKADQLDVALVPPSEIKQYIAQQGPGYSPDWFADDTTFSLMIPNTSAAPMNDARVTRALRLLVDHDELMTAWAEAQYGRGTLGSIFPTAMSAWDLTQDEYRSHLEWKQPKDEAAKEAVSLLSAAGFSKEKPLRFSIEYSAGIQQSAAVQLLQAQWKRWSQGIVDTDGKGDPVAVGSSVRAQGAFTYAHVGFSAGPADPDTWLSSAFRTGGSSNYSRLSDPKLDAMIDKQRGVFDGAQRKAAVRDIVLYMIDNAPVTIGSNLYWLQAAKPKLQGFAPCNTLNGRIYGSVWFAS